MQKQYRNKNLLRSNARNQRQQIKPRRKIKDRCVREKIENNAAIQNFGHLYLLHAAVGGSRCFLRTFAVQPRAQIRRIPIPPIVFSVRLLVLPMMLLCFAQQFRKRADVDLSRCRCFHRISNYANGTRFAISLRQACAVTRMELPSAPARRHPPAAESISQLSRLWRSKASLLARLVQLRMNPRMFATSLHD